MRTVFIPALILLLSGLAVSGQGLTASPSPSKEAFLDRIAPMVIDSNFSSYYLAATARPCSFIKYDYDEWVKYGMDETVTIDVMNELARQSYFDRRPLYWVQDSLSRARCIPEEKAGELLDPGKKPGQWYKRPPEERTVYYFSRPLFTDDGAYALIDLDKRCDARQCGVGATCLFRKTGSGWKLVGRMIRWGG